LNDAEENNRHVGGKGEKAGQEPTADMVTCTGVRRDCCKVMYTGVSRVARPNAGG